MVTQGAGTRISAEARNCINDCMAAANASMETMAYCLEQGARQDGAALLGRLLDCAELARTTAGFLLRSSELQARACALCAEVCGKAAQAIGQVGDDPTLKSLQETLLRCATSCKALADAATASPSYDKTVADSFPASDPQSSSSAV